MKFKILIPILLLLGCSHVPDDKRAIEILDAFQDKKIAIVSPGSNCDDTKQQALFELVEGRKNIEFLPYTDHDHEKAEILKKALLDDKNDIVWTLRGGYGTSNVIEILYDDKDLIQMIKNKKTYPYVVGYSDITALHLFLSQEFGWQTIHGSVFAEINSIDKDIKNFKKIKEIIDGLDEKVKLPLEPLNQRASESNEILGKITGGNLSIIRTSLGTRWQIDSKNKILFLEDCNEKPYRIARTLYHMKAAGLFNEVKALTYRKPL